MFQIGDKVVVNEAFLKHHEEHWPNFDRKEYVGKVGVIVEVEEVSKFWGIEAYEIMWANHSGDLFGHEIELVKE